MGFELFWWSCKLFRTSDLVGSRQRSIRTLPNHTKKKALSRGSMYSLADVTGAPRSCLRQINSFRRCTLYRHQSRWEPRLVSFHKVTESFIDITKPQRIKWAYDLLGDFGLRCSSSLAIWSCSWPLPSQVTFQIHFYQTGYLVVHHQYLQAQNIIWRSKMDLVWHQIEPRSDGDLQSGTTVLRWHDSRRKYRPGSQHLNVDLLACYHLPDNNDNPAAVAAVNVLEVFCATFCWPCIRTFWLGSWYEGRSVQVKSWWCLSWSFLWSYSLENTAWCLGNISDLKDVSTCHLCKMVSRKTQKIFEPLPEKQKPTKPWSMEFATRLPTARVIS